MSSEDLRLEFTGAHNEIALVTLTRAAKRNALNDGLVLALRNLFDGLPATVRAAVIAGEGEVFVAVDEGVLVKAGA